MSTAKIERNLLERAAASYVTQKKNLDQMAFINKKSRRTQHFEQSYKKK